MQDPEHNMSTDQDVYLHRGPLITGTAKVLMLSLITLLLVAPVIICITFDDVRVRISVIVLSMIIFLLMLSRLSDAKMKELVLAGATSVSLLTPL